MRTIKFCASLFSIILLTNCNSEAEQRKAYVEKEIKRRVEDYKNQRDSDCRVTALDLANRQVDSILLTEAKRADSLTRTPLPARPTRPNVKSALDTMPVKPILPKD